MVRSRFAGAVCLALCLGWLTAGAETKSIKKLELDLFMDFERASGPRISPGGERIIYTRRWVNKLKDRWDSSLWIMNADGSRNRFLIDGSNARWSPGGDRIAYIDRGDPKGRQLFVRWMDAEGSVTQITRLENSPSNPSWSPDGKHIAFVMLDKKPNRWPIKMPKAPQGAEWTRAPKIVERMNWRRDRIGAIDTGYRHIFLVPAEGGTPRQVTSGDFNHTNIEWSPDGQSILFSGLRAEDAEYQWREREIYVVDIASGDIKQLTTRKGPDGGPKVSPDGNRVAYTGYDLTDDTYITQKIYLMDIDGSNPRLISGSWDRSPRNLRWDAVGDGLYFNARDRGTMNLYYLPVGARGPGQVRAVSTGTHMLSVSDITDDGLAVGTLSSYHTPGDIVSFDVSNPDRIRQLTHVNDDILKGVTLGEVHEIRYQSVGGLEIQGWYITPPDFDPEKRYPLQLHIHGGPHGMYHTGFNFGWQNQAANGYVVLYTNPRGSSGYGSEFGNTIKNAYPSQDYDDLMGGVDLLLKRDFIDEQNMNVTGCSGGGVLTAWVVGHTDRFAAASSNCPVIDWVSFVGTTDGSSWYRNFKKLPWDDPSEHIRRSPLTYVGNVKTPTMLMTGVKDLRTPMPQTEQFYSALKLLKVPTAMIRFNDEWHGTSSKPSNFMRTQLYLRYWFERHARKPEQMEIPAGKGESGKNP